MFLTPRATVVVVSQGRGSFCCCISLPCTVPDVPSFPPLTPLTPLTPYLSLSILCVGSDKITDAHQRELDRILQISFNPLSASMITDMDKVSK
jgi:hypothetical protein